MCHYSAYSDKLDILYVVWLCRVVIMTIYIEITYNYINALLALEDVCEGVQRGIISTKFFNRP